jgi:hypothetical protein
MKKELIGEFPKFFDRYINLVEDLSLFELFEKYSPDLVFNDLKKYNQIGDEIYAHGKWTIKDILQHCIDTERIMAYRALCFARNDDTILPGFDENQYAKNTSTKNATIEDLITEFSLVRKSNVWLFKSFDKTMLLRKGTANLTRISPLALGFVIVGHALHHEQIIKERYYNL